MIQFLRSCWHRFVGWFRPETEGPSPEGVQPKDAVCRFIYNPRDFSRPAMKPMPRAFLPERGTGTWETSVGRLALMSDSRAWEVGRAIRSPLVPVARTDVLVEAVNAAAVRVVPAPDEANSYPEHAVIVGWPEVKHEQKSVAAKLAFAATLQLPPPEP